MISTRNSIPAALAIALLMAGCQPASSSATETPDCATLAAPIHGLAWTADGEALFASVGETSAQLLTLVEIDPDALQSRVIGEIAESLDMLAVDGDGRPAWVSADVEGNARLMRWDDGGPTLLGPLPHPRFQHLAGTAAGLVAVESTISDEDVGPEAARLVRFDVGPEAIALVPLNGFTVGVFDASSSADGGVLATAHATASGGTIEATSTGLPKLEPSDGVARVDVWRDGASVGYRAAGGSFWTWDLATGGTRQVTDAWTYDTALSNSGRLAYALRSDQDGRTGTVCVMSVVPK